MATAILPRSASTLKHGPRCSRIPAGAIAYEVILSLTYGRLDNNCGSYRTPKGEPFGGFQGGALTTELQLQRGIMAAILNP